MFFSIVLSVLLVLLLGEVDSQFVEVNIGRQATRMKASPQGSIPTTPNAIATADSVAAQLADSKAHDETEAIWDSSSSLASEETKPIGTGSSDGAEHQDTTDPGLSGEDAELPRPTVELEDTSERKVDDWSEGKVYNPNSPHSPLEEDKVNSSDLLHDLVDFRDEEMAQELGLPLTRDETGGPNKLWFRVVRRHSPLVNGFAPLSIGKEVEALSPGFPHETTNHAATEAKARPVHLLVFVARRQAPIVKKLSPLSLFQNAEASGDPLDITRGGVSGEISGPENLWFRAARRHTPLLKKFHPLSIGNDADAFLSGLQDIMGSDSPSSLAQDWMASDEESASTLDSGMKRLPVSEAHPSMEEVVSTGDGVLEVEGDPRLAPLENSGPPSGAHDEMEAIWDSSSSLASEETEPIGTGSSDEAKHQDTTGPGLSGEDAEIPRPTVEFEDTSERKVDDWSEGTQSPLDSNSPHSLPEEDHVNSLELSHDLVDADQGNNSSAPLSRLEENKVDNFNVPYEAIEGNTRIDSNVPYDVFEDKAHNTNVPRNNVEEDKFNNSTVPGNVVTKGKRRNLNVSEKRGELKEPFFKGAEIHSPGILFLWGGLFTLVVSVFMTVEGLLKQSVCETATFFSLLCLLPATVKAFAGDTFVVQSPWTAYTLLVLVWHRIPTLRLARERLELVSSAIFFYLSLGLASQIFDDPCANIVWKGFFSCTWIVALFFRNADLFERLLTLARIFTMISGFFAVNVNFCADGVCTNGTSSCLFLAGIYFFFPFGLPTIGAIFGRGLQRKRSR